MGEAIKVGFHHPYTPKHPIPLPSLQARHLSPGSLILGLMWLEVFSPPSSSRHHPLVSHILRLAASTPRLRLLRHQQHDFFDWRVFWEGILGPFFESECTVAEVWGAGHDHRVLVFGWWAEIFGKVAGVCGMSTLRSSPLNFLRENGHGCLGGYL